VSSAIAGSSRAELPVEPRQPNAASVVEARATTRFRDEKEPIPPAQPPAGPYPNSADPGFRGAGGVGGQHGQWGGASASAGL